MMDPRFVNFGNELVRKLNKNEYKWTVTSFLALFERAKAAFTTVERFYKLTHFDSLSQNEKKEGTSKTRIRNGIYLL